MFGLPGRASIPAGRLRVYGLSERCESGSADPPRCLLLHEYHNPATDSIPLRPGPPDFFANPGPGLLASVPFRGFRPRRGGFLWFRARGR